MVITFHPFSRSLRASSILFPQLHFHFYILADSGFGNNFSIGHTKRIHLFVYCWCLVFCLPYFIFYKTLIDLGVGKCVPVCAENSGLPRSNFAAGLILTSFLREVGTKTYIPGGRSGFAFLAFMIVEKESMGKHMRILAS